jgi:catechol 2,3-dioxygenase-like lactoylglutathione lyase family enzyme
MKRLHVHVKVNDLAQSIRFYSTLFASEPTVVKPDYAKWMLDDPRVNFAISTSGGDHTGKVEIGDRAARRRTAGISHLGIQVEDETELAEVYGRRPKH